MSVTSLVSCLVRRMQDATPARRETAVPRLQSSLSYAVRENSQKPSYRIQIFWNTFCSEIGFELLGVSSSDRAPIAVYR